MSDAAPEATGTAPRLSPSRLGLYLECPRKFQFDREWRVSSPRQSERPLNFGRALHETLAWVARRVRAPDPDAEEAPWRDRTVADPARLPWPSLSPEDVSEETIHAYAREEFEAAWAAETTPNEYVTDAYYRYDKQVGWAAIEAYLADRGVEDIRRAVGAEIEVSFDRSGMGFTGRIDMVVRTDTGLEIIDYKRTRSSIITGSYYLYEHLAGERFAPRRVKSLIQAGIYLEAVELAGWAQSLASTLSSADDSLEFSFYGLLGYNGSVDEKATADGISVTVNGSTKAVSDIYAETKADLWQLIEQCYRGIVAADYDARGRLAERNDGSESICDRCTYNDMCPEILETEVTRVE